MGPSPPPTVSQRSPSMAPVARAHALHALAPRIRVGRRAPPQAGTIGARQSRVATGGASLSFRAAISSGTTWTAAMNTATSVSTRRRHHRRPLSRPPRQHMVWSISDASRTTRTGTLMTRWGWCHPLRRAGRPAWTRVMGSWRCSGRSSASVPTTSPHTSRCLTPSATARLQAPQARRSVDARPTAHVAATHRWAHVEDSGETLHGESCRSVASRRRRRPRVRRLCHHLSRLPRQQAASCIWGASLTSDTPRVFACLMIGSKRTAARRATRRRWNGVAAPAWRTSRM